MGAKICFQRAGKKKKKKNAPETLARKQLGILGVWGGGGAQVDRKGKMCKRTIALLGRTH